MPNQYGKQKISIKNNINSKEWNIRLLNIFFNKQDPMKSQIAYLDVVGKTYYYYCWCAQNSRWPIITWQHSKTILILKFITKKVLTLKSHDIAQFILYLALYFVILQKNIVEYKKRINEENEYKLYCCVMITLYACVIPKQVYYMLKQKEKRFQIGCPLFSWRILMTSLWPEMIESYWNKLKYFYFKCK